MKTILWLVATTGLLIGSAAIGYAQQGITSGGTAQQGSTLGGAAQQGSTFGGTAQPGSTFGGAAQQGGTTSGAAAPGPGVRGNPGQDDLTIGRGDRSGCTTQTYVVPSEQTGDKTSVGVTRC